MLKETIKKFSEQKVLVIGDMVADIYLDGRIGRISREAPVLVLTQAGEKIIPGGAANVVNNIASLGGTVFAAGIIGNDKGGAGIKGILEDNGAKTEGFIVDETRPTITKTRIIAGGRATVSQQIVRVDNESDAPLSESSQAKLLSYLKETLPKVQGVILSDYGSKTVTEKIRNYVIESAKKYNLFSMVDSRYDVKKYKGIGYIKQNDGELASAMEREFRTADELKNAAEELVVKLEAKGALITRGENGMTIAKDNGVITDIPVTDKSEVFDVSGAGDTTVAAFILGLCAGATPENAAVISNYAAGIAVRKYGTATVSKEELLKVIKE